MRKSKSGEWNNEFLRYDPCLPFSEEKPVVWAVNKSWLRRQLQELFGRMAQDEKVEKAWSRREGWVFDMIFVKSGSKAETIAAVNPFTLNDRLVVQQGLFLCPTDVSQSFHKLLNDMKGSASNIYCIPISLAAREQILLRLHSAGVHHAALFPGLEGFAKSLRTKMLLYRHMQKRREKGGRVGLKTMGV